MTFRNPLLLAGIAAAVLPLVLHLLQRARARGVTWGAMPMLAGAERRSAAGPRVRHAVVLFLRATAVAVLAVTLARPVFTADAADGAGTNVVFVVDGSPSTLYPEQNATRFELARQAALDRLGRLRRGDQAGLIELGQSPPADITVSPDLQAVASQLVSMTVGPGAADMADGERRARAMLGAAGIDGGEIDLIGDRQRTTWAGLSRASSGTEPAADDPADTGPRVVAIPVGSTQRRNVVVESMTLLNPPAVVGVPATFVVRIRNDGDVPQGGLTLSLSTDRAAAGQTPVAVAAEAHTDAERTLTFDRPGSTVVTAAVNDSGVPADDTERCAVDVIEPPRVLRLIPAGTPAGSADAVSTRGPFRATTAAVLSSTGPPPDVVVAAHAIDDAQVTALEHYVADGGALLLAPPAVMTAGEWNERYWKGGFGLAAAASEAAAAGRGRPHAPVDLPSCDPAAVAWTDVDVTRRFALTAGPPETVLVDIRGEPFVVERAFGRGRVIVVATPLDAGGTARPTPDTYDGLTESLVRRLVTREPDRNLGTGAPIEFTTRLPRERFASVLRPDGRSDRTPVVVAGTQGIVRYTRTDRPGRYVVRIGDQPARDWVVHNDPAESDPSSLDDAALAAIVGPDGVVLRAADVTEAAPRGLDTGALLCVALVSLLAVESGLATAAVRSAVRSGGRA